MFRLSLVTALLGNIACGSRDTREAEAPRAEGGRLVWRTPRLLFRGGFEASPLRMPNNDVSLDGQRILMIEPGEDDRPPSALPIVLNWFEELNARVPRK